MLKVKNIAFTGFMAAILMGATATDARAVSVASTEYVNAQVGAVSGEVTTLSATVDTKAAASDVTALTGRVDTAESDIDSLEGRVGVNEGAIATNTEAIRVLNADANTEGSVKQQIKKLTDDLTTTGGSVETVSLKVTQLEGRVDTAESDIDTLEGYVGGKSVADSIAEALTTYSTTAQVEEKINVATTDMATNSSVDTKLQSYYTSSQVDTKLGDYALQSKLDAEESARKAADESLASKQDALSGTGYVVVDQETDTVSLKVDGEIAAGNEGLVKGSQIYTYALPKPADCENETCVLSVDLEGQPYWMKLELPATQGA